MKSPQNNNIWINRIFSSLMALLIVAVCSIPLLFVLSRPIYFLSDVFKIPEEHTPMISDEMVLSIALTILASGFLFVYAYKKLMRYCRK